MLQILSTSNETATGTELVQNGNFSQLGADLVENGLFDELGTDVITNGGFTGVTELMPTIGTIVNQGGGSITLISGISYSSTSDGTSGSSFRPKIDLATTSLKSYKLVITPTSTPTGTANCDFYDGSSYLFQDYDFTTTKEIYFVDNGSVVLFIDGTQIYDIPSFTISVKEVGEDWTNGTGWSFGDNKAISTQALGSEEVTNGDFSAAGINLVDNPNFTDTGAELITDGAFPTGTTAWIINGLTTISGDAANLTADSSVNNYIFQNTLGTNTNSGSFVLSYEITANTIIGDSATALDTSSGGAIITGSLKVLPTTIGSHEVYFISKATGTNSQLQLRTRTTATGGSLSITNISVKELGADWTLGSGWSIGDSKAICAANGGYDALNQGSVLNSGSSYKVTYTADVSLITSGTLKLSNFSELGTERAVLDGTNTVYLTANGGTFQVNEGGAVGTATITNISVQELGEDWTAVDAGVDTYDENGLTITSLTGVFNRVYQSSVTQDSAQYKVTYSIYATSYSAGSRIKYYNGNSYVNFPEQGVGTHTFYYTREGTLDNWYFNLETSTSGSTTDFVTISSISVKEIATSYLTQTVSLSAKTWKLIYSVSDYIAGSVSATDYGAVTTANAVGITEYVEIGAISDFRMVNIDGYFEGAVTDISAQLVDPNGYWSLGSAWSFGDGKVSCDGSVSTSNLSQIVSSFSGKSFLVKGSLSNVTQGFVYISLGGTDLQINLSASGDFERYVTIASGNSTFYVSARNNFIGSITNISVEQVDPNDYWTLGTGWSIGTDKAISSVTGSNSDITQSILTAGKTYRTVYEIVDYDAGTAQAVVTGSEGADAVAIETYTEDLTTTGTDFSIRSKLGTFDGAVSSVSVKQLGTYEDQSIYVTAADVQTIAQASVYYLIELTSMGSKNSLYFLPSSVVPNNGRYTKLNFTVISKDAIQQPTLGIISFYDSVGGLDTYPMGFYEFRIYEQTSSTNLDPLLATGLLEKGFAFVRDFSGNMQELTDGFKEYNPALTQYVYSK